MMTRTDPERARFLQSLDVLSLDEAAERSRVSRSTIRRAIDNGELTARSLGRNGRRGRVVIPARHLNVWLGLGIEGGEA